MTNVKGNPVPKTTKVTPHPFYLNSYTKIVDFNGDLHTTQDIPSDYIFEGMSCVNGGDVKKNTLQKFDEFEEFDTINVITLNNGSQFYLPPDGKVLTSYGTTSFVNKLDVGDCIQSGCIRYDNNEWIPNIIFELNYVIENLVHNGAGFLFSKVFSVKDNIILGEASDGETNFIAVAA